MVKEIFARPGDNFIELKMCASDEKDMSIIRHKVEDGMAPWVKVTRFILQLLLQDH